MATQYIEDPETKEKIPFEWDKSTSPTSDDIDSLFKAVKASKSGTMLPSTTVTPEEKPSLQEKVGQFFSWPGLPEAGRQFIRGMTLPLGIGGAALGSTFGPLGTALGYAGGERVGKALETVTGVSPPETPKEAIMGTAFDIGLGLIPEAPAIAKGGIQTAKSLMRKPSIRIEEVFEAVGKGKAEPLIAGEFATKSAKQRYSNLSGTGNKLYQTAEKITPEGATLNLENTYNTIDRILKDESITEPGIKKFAQDILERISPEVRSGGRGRAILSPELQAEIKGELGIITKPSTFKEAYGTRTMLSKASTKEGPMKHYAGEMLDALNQDLAEGATKLNIPEVNTAYKKAINFWRDEVVPQRQMIKAVESKSPEKIVDLFMKDVKNARQLKKGLPEEDVQSLKQSIFTRISTVSKTDKQAVENIQKLFRTKKEVMKEIFDKEEFEAIKLATDPTKFGQYLEEHPRVRWLVKWIPVGLAIEAGRRVMGGRLPATAHHGMESKATGGPVLPAFPLSKKETVGMVLPPGIIATRGVLRGKEYPE